MIKFQLTNCATGVARVYGSSTAVDTNLSLQTDATGVLASTLWPNDVLNCGGVTGQSRWLVTQVLNNVPRGAPVCYNVLAAHGLNLDQDTPCPRMNPPTPPGTANDGTFNNGTFLGQVDLYGAMNIHGANAAFGAANTNGVLYADLFPGLDIGAKINAAIAFRNGACGTVAIAPGSYTFATQIVKPRCIVLEGNNAVLTWAGSGLYKAAITTGSVAGVDYTWGGIHNLKLIGTGTGPGIYLGRATGSYVAQAGVDDYLEEFRNVVVTGFADNYVKGLNTYQLEFIGGASTSGAHTNWLDLGFGSENMNFHGWQNLNSAGIGFYSADLQGAAYNFYGCSFDYNLGGAFFYINGDVRLFGGHIEQANPAYFFDSPESSAAFRLTLTGGVQFVLGGSNLPVAPIHVVGTNSAVFIGQGLNLAHFGSNFSELILWEASGQSNQLTVEPYADPLAYTGKTPGAVQAGANIQWLSVPTYNQYVPTGKYVSQQTIGAGNINTPIGAKVGVIATGVNFGGTVPLLADCSQIGSTCLGWNATTDTQGESDYFNGYSDVASGKLAHAWWTLVNGVWTLLGGVTRNGKLYMPGGSTDGINGTVNGLCYKGGIVVSTSPCTQ